MLWHKLAVSAEFLPHLIVMHEYVLTASLDIRVQFLVFKWVYCSTISTFDFWTRKVGPKTLLSFFLLSVL